uniref:FAD-binding oxidoreductase n=1 Tax=uncultured Caballeronia sp. TaxID=1827198 RepID=UPI0035CB1F5C
AFCSNAADVARAVNFARKLDILVAVRSGGHNVAGRALCDDGIVIDLSRMNDVTVDAESRTVRVQAGALLGDIDRKTHLHGLAVPTGVVSKTGIAGLTLGGGVGWLVRKYGLTIDNLLSCDVVTAKGELLLASDKTNANLFWGLRGGGGNFGIVTSFLFRAHPVSTVLGGMILYPREQASAVLRHYRGFMSTAPEELTAYAALISTPDGMPVAGVIVCYCGELVEGEQIIAPLRQFGAPLLDAIGPMPFPALQSMLDGAFPDGMFNYWKSTFLTKLSDEAIDLIVDHGNRARSPLSGVTLEFYGGAPARVDHAHTAFGQRNTAYNVGITAQWKIAAEGDEHVIWARSFSDALVPYSSGSNLLNFQSDNNTSAICAAFGSNYPRLVELKTQYDPGNFFSLNQNIEPHH